MSLMRAARIVSAGAATLFASCAHMRYQVGPETPKARDDIVYLEDGSTVHGIIVERVAGASLSVRTRDGAVFVLQEAQIRRVDQRSPQGAAAPGMPVVRMPDSALARAWARIDTDRLGGREGRVMGLDAHTLVLRERGRFVTTPIARAEIRQMLVSTSQSRAVGKWAVIDGLGSAVILGLFASGLGADAPTARTIAFVSGALGAGLGAGLGYLVVRHEGWRRLDLGPAINMPPVSTGQGEVGARARP